MIFQDNKGNKVDFNNGFDLSIPLSNDERNPRAWYVNAPKFEPVRSNGWIGAVAEGGSVNFRAIFFNPHGHGTHTECLGHITKEIHSINEHLQNWFFKAQVISIKPIQINNDLVITPACFPVLDDNIEALIVRTLPNDNSKLSKNYSDSNPPYFSTECLAILEEKNIAHLLIDLPSVDREKDDGKLAFHHGFWQVPDNPQFHKTITEFIFVPDHVTDDIYLLNLQVAPFENDASPSRPVIFPFLKE
ncbi:MAG: cyclase family protein [Crocinitomicaceae bacterium]|nr:cyclase family protein [Crocinitomicaceae bacterium]